MGSIWLNFFRPFVRGLTVSLILGVCYATHGSVMDLEETKPSIRNASSTALLSIVIVGIGLADFSAMQFLDDLRRDEGVGTRDIVQFDEFSRHKHDKDGLTKETLDEIPNQLIDYFYRNRIRPLAYEPS